MAKETSKHPITSFDYDWEKGTPDKKPHSGKQLREFLGQKDRQKLGYQKYYEDDSTYRYFANKESADLWEADREGNADLVLAQHEGQNPYYAVINLISSSRVDMLLGTGGNYIDFTFDIKNNRTNQSTGEGVVCTLEFTNGATIQKRTLVMGYGQSVHELIDDYLKEGVNTVVIKVQGRKNTSAETQLAVTYNVISMSLDTVFAFERKVDDVIEIDYAVSAAEVKYMEWYVDGASIGTDTITDPSANRSKNIDVRALENGKHNLQARCYISSGTEKFYSLTHYYDFVKGGTSEATVLFAKQLPSGSLVSDRLRLSGVQYEDMSIDFAMYDPRERTLPITISNGVSRHISNGERQSLVFTPQAVGESELVFAVDGKGYSVVLDIMSNPMSMTEALSDIVLRLTAKGRSNDETNPRQWVYNDYHATFKGVNFDTQDGWHDGALVLKKGGTMSLNIKPFASNPVNVGKTIEIDFATDDVEDDNAAVISCVSEEGVGLQVTASQASLRSSGGAVTASKFKPRERMKIAFCINKRTGTDYPRFIYTYINGVLCFPDVYADGDTFANGGKQIVFGNSDGLATLKIYAIRIYNRVLTSDEELSNYAVDSDDSSAIATRNDVYVEGTSNLSLDKVRNILPTCLITCANFQTLIDASDKKTAVYGSMEFTNPYDHTLDFFCKKARLRKQGTSSLSYPRPNVKTDKYEGMTDADGNDLKGAYSFRHGSAPSDCHTWKTDFMESSMSHNTGVARLWNDIMRDVKLNGEFVCRTKAQAYAMTHEHPYDVRTTVDGFPSVMFYRTSETSEPIFLGLYNFNNDKSNLAVFGWEGIEGYDASKTECWESLKEDGLCLFSDVTNFDKDWATYFEGRQPDGYTNTTNLKKFATWVASTKGDIAKWKAEKAEYIDEWKMAAYYIYTMFFTAVDQITKNSMLTTEDGKHWFYINYDNDTINGLNNAGFLQFLYNLMRNDITDEGAEYPYGYQGHESVIFNNFEADEEFMAKVRQLAEAMYEVGLSYNSAIDMFVNKQSKQFPERLHNASQEYKYFKSKLEGRDYLYACQGTREAHLKYFLSKRTDLLESMWCYGSYISKTVLFKSNGADFTHQRDRISIVSSDNHYFGWRANGRNMSVGNYLERGESLELHTGEITQGDIIYVMGANKIATLDLSDFIGSLVTIDVTGAFDVNNGSKMARLLLSNDGEVFNQTVVTIAGLSKLESLEELDIRRYKGITNLDDDLKTLRNLKVFKAENSGLTSFAPSNGAVMDYVSLPNNMQVMRMNGVTIKELHYTPNKSLRVLSLENIAFDTLSFVRQWIESQPNLEISELTLSGINWEEVDVDFMLSLKQLSVLNIKGYVRFKALTYEDYNRLVEAYGENCFSTDSALVFDAPDAIFFHGTDNIISGESTQFTAVVFPVSDKKPSFSMYNGTEYIVPQGDIAEYKNVRLNVVTGRMETTEYPETVSLRVVASVGGATSPFHDISVKAAISPTDIFIDDEMEVSSLNTEYEYPLRFTPSNFNIGISRVIVADVTQGVNGELGLLGDKDKIVVIPKTRPNETEEHTIKVQVTTERNKTISKNFTVRFFAKRATDISVKEDGVEKQTITFSSNGTKNVTFDYLPSDSNIGIKSVEVSAPSLSNISFSNITPSGMSITVKDIRDDSMDLDAVNIIATDENGNTITKRLEIYLYRVVPTEVSIVGKEAVSAKNGIARVNFDIVYSPSNYNTDTYVPNVSCSHPKVRISNVTKTSFVLEATADEDERYEATIYLVTAVNGRVLSTEKKVVIGYEVFIYEGVGIQHTDGTIYTKDEWTAKGYTYMDANGISLGDGLHVFLLGLKNLPASAFGCNVVVPNVPVVTNTDLAMKDFNGYEDTQQYLLYGNTYDIPMTAVRNCDDFVFPNGANGYMGSVGEWQIVVNNKDEINEVLKMLGVDLLDKLYWTSTQYNEDTQWTAFLAGSNKFIGSFFRSESTSFYSRAFTLLNISSND